MQKFKKNMSLFLVFVFVFTLVNVQSIARVLAANTYVTSTVYSVDEVANIITNVPAITKSNTLMQGITMTSGLTAKLYQKDGTTEVQTSGLASYATVLTSMKLKVFNGTTVVKTFIVVTYPEIFSDEIVVTGNNTNLYADDQSTAGIDIGFNFNYYGVDYLQTFISTNGAMMFGIGNNTWTNTDIPNSLPINNAIMPFWDDIVVQNYGDAVNAKRTILYKTVGTAPNRKFVAQWTNQFFYDDPTLQMGTFQAIIYENTNKIQLQYRELMGSDSSFGSSATVGIENANGTAAVKYSYNSPMLRTRQAISFVPNGSGSYNMNPYDEYDPIYILDELLPDMPVLLSPSNGGFGVISPVEFKWQQTARAENYKLIGSTSPSFTTVNFQSGDLSSTTTSYTVPGLSTETTYYWKIIAKNSKGQTVSTPRSFATGSLGSPQISPIQNQIISRNTSTGDINFTVTDIDTPLQNVLVAASSSNQTLIPNENIVLGGTEGNRTINVTAASNVSGSSNITMVAQDGDNVSISTFIVKVNDKPTISEINNVSVVANSNTGNINFTIGDVETPAANLLVSASSSNTSVVPDANITFSGSGADKNILVTSQSGKLNGNSTITITVTDEDALTVSKSFVVTLIEPLVITLTEEPTTPTNQDVSITASITATNGVVIQKWMSGTKVVSDFASAGTSFTGNSFSVNANGYYTVYVKDNNGNEVVKTINITNIDKTPPTIPTLVTSNTNPTNANVTVTVTYPGDASVKQYKIGSGAWTSYTGPVVVSANDTISAQCQDSVGNWSTVGSLTIANIDKTPPTIPTLVTSNTNPTNANITVTITYPGDASIKQYKIGSGEWISYTAPIVVSDNDIIFAQCQDLVGNWSTVGSLTIVNIDKTPPTTPTLVSSNTNLTNANVMVTITYPGDASIKQYKIGSGLWTSYTGPVVVSTNDTISALCQDLVANWSLVGSLAITNIDKVNPTLIITGNPTAWTSSNATLNILAEVGSSGVQSVTVQKDGGAVTNITGQSSFTALTNGSYKFIVTNGAGVTDTQTIIVEHIDKVAPVLSIDSIKTGGSNYNYSGTVPTEQDVIFTLSDTNNVISGTTFYLSMDGINWNIIAGNTFTVANTNDTTVNYKFKAISGSGLETAASSPNPVYVVKPNFTNNIVVDAKTSDNAVYTGSWTNKDITYTLTGGINSIAFLKYQYSTNPSNSASWADMGGVGYDTLTVSDDTDTKYYFRVVSKGLSTGSQTIGSTLRLDNTTPTDLAIEFKGNAFKSFLNTITFGIFSKLNVDVNITVDSNISGIDYVEYQLIDTSKNESYDAINGTWVKYSSLAVAPQFKGVVYARAMDNAGNMSAVVSSDGLVVDNVQPTSPTITATIDGSPYTGAWTNKDIVIIASGASALSGVHHYEYKFGTSGVWNTMPQSTGAVDTTSGLQINDKLTITETIAGSYYFRAISNSGETGTETGKVIKHDNTVPITNVVYTGTVESWTKNKVDFTVTNTNDNVLCQTTYWKKVGNGAWTQLLPTYDPVASKLIYSYSFDVEMNAEVMFKTVTEAGVEDISATTYSVMIDKSAPVISGAVQGTDYFIGRAITINDNSIDLCNAVYKLNSGSDTSFSSGDLLSSVGIYDVTVTDRAGNVSNLSFSVKVLPTVPEVLYTSQWDNFIKDIRSEFATHNHLPEPYKTNTDNAIKALENGYNILNLEVTTIKQEVVAIKNNIDQLPSINDGLIAMLSTIQNEYDKIAGGSSSLTPDEKIALIDEKNDLKQLLDTIAALQNKNADIASKANAIPTEYNGLFFQKDNIQAILDEIAVLTNEQKTLLKITSDKLNALIVTISVIQANIDATIAVVPVVSSIGTGTTTNNLPTISGTGYPGSIITIYDNGTIIGTTTVNPAGTWSFTPATPLPEGTNIITTKSTHITGFDGTESSPITLKVDTKTSTVPTVGSVATGTTTNNKPVISGTGLPGATIIIYDNGTEIGKTKVNPDGTWSFTPETALPEGSNVITTKSTDVTGKVGTESSPITLKVDTTVPTVPVVNSVSSGTTGYNTPVISGTGLPGATITIYDNGTAIGTTKVNPDGTWSFIPKTALSEGANVITTRSTDVTGTLGTPSAPITLKVDTQIFRDIEADAANLNIVFADGDSLDNVTKALYLPKIGGSGSVITWSSSNSTTITNTGRITRPEPESQDVSVILTATITDPETNTAVTKEFILIVKKLSNQDAANEAAKQLTVEDALSFDSTGDKWESVTERFLLLSKGNYNTTISWTSNKTSIIDITINSNGDIVSSVTRPEIEDENVILTATITKGSAISTKTFLITVKQKGVTKQEDTTRVNTDTNATIVSDTSENPVFVNIMRTTLDDQAGIIDTLILTNESITELTDRIDPTADSDARTVTINMPQPTDGTPAADEQAVEIPALAVQAMAERNAILEVNMGDVKIRIDSEELKAISESGTDLYFKVVPIDDKMQQSKLSDRTKSNGAVIQIAANLGNGIVVTQGVPYAIETNYSGFNTKLVIPFNGMTVPIENLTDFLDSLRVYVEHTDGTREVLGGTIIYESGKPIGIEITIDRFSSFQIFSIQQAKANSALPKTGNVLDILTISALGVVLILTGIGILSFRRKRRNK